MKCFLLLKVPVRMILKEFPFLGNLVFGGIAVSQHVPN